MYVKTKRKYFIGAVILIILLIGVYLFSRKVETAIYIGIANPSENIELLVKIDDSKIFSDTIGYNPFNYAIIKVHLKGGFHKLYVHSNKDDLTTEKDIFLLFKQHVVIEYFPKSDDNKERASFFIRNRLTPFYME